MNTFIIGQLKKSDIIKSIDFAGKSDAELRELIVRMALQGMRGCSIRPCSIRMLAGLSHASLTNLVNDFKRKVCMEILDEPCSCHASIVSLPVPVLPNL